MSQPNYHSNIINTTLQQQASEIKSLFVFLDENIIGDIVTLSNIEKGVNNAKTYCAVPQAQCLFSFCDLLGYLISKNKDVETTKNLKEFFSKYCDSNYTVYFPILKKIYRHGIMHSYFPKSIYWGISKNISSDDNLFKGNSLNVKKFALDILYAYKKLKDDCLKSDNLTNQVLMQWNLLQNKGNEDAIIQFFALVPEKCSIHINQIRRLKPFEIWFDVHVELLNFFSEKISSFKGVEIITEDKFFHDEFITYRVKVRNLKIASNIIDKIIIPKNEYFENKIFWYCTRSAQKESSSPDLFLIKIENKIVEQQSKKYSEIYQNKILGILSFKYFITQDPRSSHIINLCRYKALDMEILAKYKDLLSWIGVFYNDELVWTNQDFDTYKTYLEKSIIENSQYIPFIDIKYQRPQYKRVKGYKLEFIYTTEPKLYPLSKIDPNIYSYYNTNPSLPSNITIDHYKGYIELTNLAYFTNVTLDDLKKFDEELNDVMFIMHPSSGSWGREGNKDFQIASLYVGLQHNKNFIVTDELFLWLHKKRVFNLKDITGGGYGFNEQTENEKFGEVFSYIEKEVGGNLYHNTKRIFTLPKEFIPKQKLKFEVLDLSVGFTLSHITELMEAGYLKYESLIDQQYSIHKTHFNRTLLTPFLYHILDEHFLSRFLDTLRPDFSKEEWYEELQKTIV